MLKEMIWKSIKYSGGIYGFYGQSMRYGEAVSRVDDDVLGRIVALYVLVLTRKVLETSVLAIAPTREDEEPETFGLSGGADAKISILLLSVIPAVVVSKGEDNKESLDCTVVIVQVFVLLVTGMIPEMQLGRGGRSCRT
jgi:hypothetical protein